MTEVATARNRSLFMDRRETSCLRRQWKEKYVADSNCGRHPLTIDSDIHQRLRMRAALRNHKYAAELSDNRISERGDHFLPVKEEGYERNLTTPSYFTKINTRLETKKGSADLIEDNFKSLTSERLDIPKYQVPANLPELSKVRSLLSSGNSSKTSAMTPDTTCGDTKQRTSLDLNGWINLLTRPVAVRPDFAEPIHCKTPHLTITNPGYQKPTKGMFKTINKKAASRDFTVHPEFISELVRIQYIQGQSSNPLKYGWA